MYNDNDQYIIRLLKLGADPSDCMDKGLNYNPDIRKIFEDYSSLSFVKGAE
jgi:hypothetical protein